MPEAISTALAGAITQLTTMVTAVVVMGVGGAVGMLAINKGAKFGLKWVKGALNQSN